jgi:hypothetical protein
MEVKSDAEMLKILMKMQPGSKVEIVKVGDTILDVTDLCDNCHANPAQEDGRCLSCFASDGSEDKF